MRHCTSLGGVGSIANRVERVGAMGAVAGIPSTMSATEDCQVWRFAHGGYDLGMSLGGRSGECAYPQLQGRNSRFIRRCYAMPGHARAYQVIITSPWRVELVGAWARGLRSRPDRQLWRRALSTHTHCSSLTPLEAGVASAPYHCVDCNVMLGAAPARWAAAPGNLKTVKAEKRSLHTMTSPAARRPPCQG